MPEGTMTQEEAKTLAEKEYPNETFGAEMCRQAYIKGLLQSPYGKCREALGEINKICSNYNDWVRLDDIRNVCREALTLDSREDQDELWKEVGRMIMAGYDESSEDIMTETLKSKFIISKK